MVTAGGRGIGLISAQALGELGAKVIITDRNSEYLESGVQFLAK